MDMRPEDVADSQRAACQDLDATKQASAILCQAQEKEACDHETIKNQALGEGHQDCKLEKLSRCETHLDRKFERSLAMLIKLKEFRGSRLG